MSIQTETFAMGPSLAGRFFNHKVSHLAITKSWVIEGRKRGPAHHFLLSSYFVPPPSTPLNGICSPLTYTIYILHIEEKE
jgi:hypothetical protein